MQLGSTRLSPAECDRCMNESRCLYYGQSGHFRVSCLELLEKSFIPCRQEWFVMGVTQISSLTYCSFQSHSPGAMKDILCRHDSAGFCRGWKFYGYFLSQEAKSSLWVPFVSAGCYCPGWVTSGPWRNNLSNTPTTSLHSATSRGDIFPSHPVFCLILGYPWLLQHNPNIDWSTNTIPEWGPTCHATCIFSSSPDASSQS